MPRLCGAGMHQDADELVNFFGFLDRSLDSLLDHLDMAECIRIQIDGIREGKVIIDFDPLIEVNSVLESLEMENEIVGQRFDRDLFDCIDVTSACLAAVFVV